ncbi:MAG: hydroxymethylpyrimidine/phosphomethylpyrimidine kinase [Vicingaceae bacterium]
MSSHPKILTIAGFDPCGGAGVLADIKTIEANKCLGMAVITANTIQNECEFLNPNWVDEKIIFEQLDCLLKKHQFNVVKIGLIPSFEFILKISSKLRENNPLVKIIWDPILSATAGFNFHKNTVDLEPVLKHVFLITPNWDEVKILSANKDAIEGAKTLAKYTTVYLKGGHSDKPGKDYLFYKGKVYPFNPKNKKTIYPKHGSGCVFSSALSAHLAKNYPIIKACLNSKRYVEHYLSSTKDLIGYHKI